MLDEQSLMGGRDIPDNALLRRSLGAWQVVSIIVSTMIGIGVFIRPASMAQDVGSVPLLLLAWLMGGLIVLALSFCYAELATSMPEAGGEYVYLRAAFGELTAFMFGWMRFVVGAGITAALSVGFAVFLSDVVPLQGQWWAWQLHLGPLQWQTQFGPKNLVSLGTIGVLAAANCVRVFAAGTVQVAFAALKVCILTALILGAASFVFHGHSQLAAIDLASHGSTPAGLPSATLAALFAYNGWASVTMVAGEVRDTGRRLARHIAIAVVLVILLYLLLNMAYAGVLPLAEFSNANSTAYPGAPSVGAKLARAIFGSGIAAVMSLVFALSAAGTLHANLLTIPRIFFSMARDGLFFPIFARVNPRSGVPQYSVILFSLWIALLTIAGGFDRLTSMATFGVFLFYALNVIGLLVLRLRSPGLERPFRVPGYPFLPLIVLAVVSWVLFRIVVRGAPEELAALLLLLIGLPVYGLFRWHRRTRIANAAAGRSQGT